MRIIILTNHNPRRRDAVDSKRGTKHVIQVMIGWFGFAPDWLKKGRLLWHFAHHCRSRLCLSLNSSFFNMFKKKTNPTVRNQKTFTFTSKERFSKLLVCLAWLFLMKCPFIWDKALVGWGYFIFQNFVTWFSHPFNSRGKSPLQPLFGSSHSAWSSCEKIDPREWDPKFTRLHTARHLHFSLWKRGAFYLILAQFRVWNHVLWFNNCLSKLIQIMLSISNDRNEKRRKLRI